MLARIAHELFWLGRNVSRAEHTARMIDGVFQVDIQGRYEGPTGITLSWDAVLAIMGATVAEDGGRRLSRAETVALLSTDLGNANSVLACLARALGRANGARGDQRRDVGGDQLLAPRARRRRRRRRRLRRALVVLW